MYNLVLEHLGFDLMRFFTYKLFDGYETVKHIDSINICTTYSINEIIHIIFLLSKYA